jgi:putative endonuclease
VDRATRGRLGEQTAAFFLSERGYVVLGKNQRTPHGELDLVCRSLSEVVVVEVKSRSSREYGDALEAIGPRKASRLRASAVWWLAERGLFPCAVRFDAVVVMLDGDGLPSCVHHLKNIIEG